jgi:hypothetical protein
MLSSEQDACPTSVREVEQYKNRDKYEPNLDMLDSMTA